MPQELPVSWASPWQGLAFVAGLALTASIITLLLCRRRTAQKKPPSFGSGLLAAFVTACLTMVISFRDDSGSLATALPGAFFCLIFLMAVSLIPALAVGVFYRRKYKR